MKLHVPFYVKAIVKSFVELLHTNFWETFAKYGAHDPSKLAPTNKAPLKKFSHVRYHYFLKIVECKYSKPYFTRFSNVQKPAQKSYHFAQS